MLPNPAQLWLLRVPARRPRAQRRPSSTGREGREGGRGKTTKLKAEPHPLRPPLPVPALIPRHSARTSLPAQRTRDSDTHGLLARGTSEGSDNSLSLPAPGSSRVPREETDGPSGVPLTAPRRQSVRGFGTRAKLLTLSPSENPNAAAPLKTTTQPPL